MFTHNCVRSCLGLALVLAGTSLGLAQPATKVDIAPPGLGLPEGTYAPVAGGTSSIGGYGSVAFANVGNATQPGDVMTFAYETLTGDFDRQLRVVGLSSEGGDDWARGGLMIRSTTSPDCASLKLAAGNPTGVNLVRMAGRGMDGQRYTTYSRDYPGVAAALPNQWLRLRRVGNYFAAYVKGANTSWALIGERYQEFPATVLVGVYAAGGIANAGTGGKATLQFADYGPVTTADVTAPRLVSGGTIDKKLVGLKFSEAIDSATAASTANYAISQGTITSAKLGIGGDSVYLGVTGLTADDFTVTVVGGLKDHAGNNVAPGSTVNVKALNWFNADSGYIQNPNARPTAGDDPYREGEAVAVSSDENPEFELVGGGSNIWDGGDYMHYIYTQIPAGDFDYAIEVSRYDRPANTAGWGNSGIHVRPSVYRTDDPVNAPPYSVNGTKVNNIAEVTYMDGGAPGRAGIGIWRMEPGGNYGAGGTIPLSQEIGGLVGAYGRLRAKDSVGTPMDKTVPEQGIWLRMQRTGSTYRTYVSYNGLDWVNSVTQERSDLAGPVLLGFATHNDTGGSAPPNNGYAENGYLTGTTNQDPNQNDSNYTVQRVKIYPSGVPVPVPVDLTKVDIVPEFPVTPPLPGAYTQSGTYSFDITGGGSGAFKNMLSDLSGGDELTFAYEKVTGDFDKQVRITSITRSLFYFDGTAYVPSEGEVLPADNWARGGLMARVDTNAVSANLKIVAGNPEGANQVVVQGRALAGQRYTAFSRSYGGVSNNLPNQWLRMQRVGNSFSFYVGKDGVNWTLVGQRYQEMPAELLVGAYAGSSLDPLAADNPNGLQGKATVKFTDYKNVDTGDVVPPRLLSAGTLDKKTIGVKFSEKVSSATATATGNYTLSQGTVTAAKVGVGGDAVYLTVNGLTANSFTVTVTGVKDLAGNSVAPGSAVQASVTAWTSADIGLIQNPNNRPTVGDDPYRKGEAVALTSDANPEFDIVGGGSNGWDPGDYVHYLHQTVSGDFDVAVEVSRYDRAANTAGWGNAGIHIRPSLFRTDDPAIQPFTTDGTKVNNLALVTYMEASAPGRAGIGIWRETAGGGYGAGGTIVLSTEIGGLVGAFGNLRAMDAAGTPMDKTTASQNIWLRVKRTGAAFQALVSYNGTDWLESFTANRADLAGNVLVGFATHNDTGGSAPPNSAYAGNGHEIDPADPLNPLNAGGNVQNESNYTVQRVRVYPNGPVVGPPGPLSISRSGNSVSISWPGTGTLESAPSVSGPWNPVNNQTNPYVVAPEGTVYYRLKQ